MKWVYLALAILSEVIGSIVLKYTEGFTKITPSIIVAVAFSSAFYFLSKTLNDIPLGIAYAIWSGIGITLINIIDIIIFKQEIDIPSVLGIILIISGVTIINLFGNNSIH